MKRRKVLIADRSEEFCMEILELLGHQYDVKTVSTGTEVLEQIKAFTPDVLVLDLVLPGMDGIALLYAAKECGLCPRTVVTNGYFSDYMQTVISELRVGYAMVRPCNIQSLTKRIGEMLGASVTGNTAPVDPRTRITNILLELGVPTNLNGFAYVREGILLYSQEPCQQITKSLYPQLGAQFRATKDQIERSIRSAIDLAWNQRDEAVWRRYFSKTKNGCLKKPTNGEFISRLAMLEVQNSFVQVS